MTLSELLAIPAVAALGLLWRRLFWFLCRCAGEVIAANEGRVVDAAGAFAIGKMKVMQTAANMLLLRLQKIEWDEIGRGLAAGFAVWRVHAYEAWKGLWRDLRRFFMAPILIRRWLRERRLEAVQAMKMVAEWQDRLGRDDGAAGQLVKANVEGLELRKAVLARELAEGVPAHLMREKVSELTHIRSFLGAHYAETEPPPQVQSLLSPVLIPARLKMMALAGLAFAVLTLGLYVQTKRVWALKDDVREVKSQAAAVVKSRDAYAASLAQRDARIENSTKICLSEIETARQSALKAEQQAARERARRIHEQRKTLDGGGAVPVSDILRNIPGLAGDSPAPGAAAGPGSPILPP